MTIKPLETTFTENVDQYRVTGAISFITEKSPVVNDINIDAFFSCPKETPLRLTMKTLSKLDSILVMTFNETASNDTFLQKMGKATILSVVFKQVEKLESDSLSKDTKNATH